MQPMSMVLQWIVSLTLIDVLNNYQLNYPGDYRTVQAIKHSNDPILNPRYGPNEYHGEQDHTSKALADLSRVTGRNEVIFTKVKKM